MAETTFRISGEGIDGITGILTPAEGQAEGQDAGWTFLYAPGAGSNIHDAFGRFACRRLAERGVTAARFQFPYMEAAKRRPDRPAVVQAAWRAAIAAVRPPAAKLVVGGRSFGGRIASQVVAQREAVDGLALFAYPLHAPGKPDQPRDEHFDAIHVPTLFCSGTRDAFASVDQLAAAAKQIAGSQVHVLEGADHGFGVTKASGRTKEDDWAEATDALLDWFSP